MLNKLAQLRRDAGAAARESLGIRRPAAGEVPNHGDSPAAQQAPGAERLKGLARPREQVVEIPLDRIVRDPGQPREVFEPEALNRLALSMKSRGQLQPCRVRWDETLERYVLIVGERRWRAAQIAGIAALVCVVAESADPREIRADQVVENLLREDLNPMEQARSLRALQEEHGWSGRRLAEELGISAVTINRSLALLRLPEPVTDLVERGELAPSTAALLLQLDDDAEQVDLGRRAAAGDWSRDDVEVEVRRLKSPAAPVPTAPEPAAESTPPRPGTPSMNAGATEGSAAGATPGPPAGPRTGQAGAPGTTSRSRPAPAPGSATAPAQSDPGGDEWLSRQQARVARAAATAAEIDGPSITEQIAAEDAALRERGAFINFDASWDHDPEVEILVGPDPNRTALVRVEGASGSEGFPSIEQALELALKEWRRQHGPASCWPPRTRVRCESPGHADHGRRGEIGAPPGEMAPGTAWVYWDDGIGAVPMPEGLLVRTGGDHE